MSGIPALADSIRPTPWKERQSNSDDRVCQTDDLLRLAGGDGRVALACAILLWRRLR